MTDSDKQDLAKLSVTDLIEQAASVGVPRDEALAMTKDQLIEAVAPRLERLGD
jgi:hypothetical protein